jgi:arsenate reductase-like glutaredoxin family protein
MEAAKAAVNTLRRDLDREKLKNALHQQDTDLIRKIIRKGGTAAEVLKFLDTKQA